jgi:hypothetical protein
MKRYLGGRMVIGYRIGGAVQTVSQEVVEEG